MHPETSTIAPPKVRTTRRRVLEYFLGGGVLASVLSFVYPVIRYLIPPTVADLGGDEVVAGKVGELKESDRSLSVAVRSLPFVSNSTHCSSVILA